MSVNKILITAKNENFVVHVLTKKAQDTGTDCIYVPCTVDGIRNEWDNSPLIILYMEEGERPGHDVLLLLEQAAKKTGRKVILIGAEADTQYVRGSIGPDAVYDIFSRPVNNSKFSRSVSDFFKVEDLGAFRKHILVVDDDPQYLTLIREWLKGDYKVSMAVSGLRAIEFLGENKVDLILLDYQMPAASGAQVLEMLRSEDETKDIPVIFLTGKSDKASVMEVMALQPQGYFLKSIKKEELLSRLQEFFETHA